MESGFGSSKALNVAKYTQLPDEIGQYDAISRAVNFVTSLFPNKNKSYLDMKKYQEGFHVLSGKRATGERKKAADIIRRASPNDHERIGFATHAYGDTFAHEKDGKTYGGFVGHLEDGTDPDTIHLRKNKFLKYSKGLLSLYSENSGVMITTESADSLQVEMSELIESSKVYKYVGRVRRKVLDDSATNLKTIENLRKRAISGLAKEDGISPEEAERMMLKPEANDLAVHGAFSTRAQAGSELNSLHHTQPGYGDCEKPCSVTHDGGLGKSIKEWKRADIKAEEFLELMNQ